MMKKTMVAFLLMFLGGAVPALGQNISAANPQAMFDYLRAEGIDASLGKDDYGDPNIRITYYDTNFSIYFYGCKDGAKCKSIQFYSGYRTEGEWTSDDANAWNQDRRFSKAYVSDNGNARLEYDVYTGVAGLQVREFADIFTNWTHSLSDFEAAIGW